MTFFSEEQKKIIYRRLILSKQLYMHGLEHSNANGDLNKMIAIHNFHNAIEISLRSIILGYEIRAEKQLNIGFESMLNEINNYDKFKQEGKKLPYRQELRNLNQLRNMVQHHAVIPESSTMDEWRVFSKRFLSKAFEQYFSIEFDKISYIDFIANSQLRMLLNIANNFITLKDNLNAIIVTKLAFMYSLYSISNFFLEESLNNDFIAGGDLQDIGIDKLLGDKISFKVEIMVRKIYEKVEETKHYAALLSSGIKLVDYKRFEELTPHIDFTLDGGYVVQVAEEYEPTDETAKWVFDFIVKTLINWQLHSLDPKVNDSMQSSCQQAIEEKKCLLNHIRKDTT